MKEILSVLLVAGVLSQISNAMGPMGDTTHRRFYKDQEWIWKTESKSKANPAASSKYEAQKFSETPVWSAILAPALPIASLPPLRPPLASLPPIRPPLASLPPLRPPSAPTS
jgi:hypothetical protein